jgi:L-ascorbate metabolism protein UlaG (beta-lactamase superfamily)
MENINWLKPSLTWFGHSSFSFTDNNGNRVYYVDPLDLKPGKLAKADLVFITHAHQDHFSPNDLLKILKDDTIIIAPPDVLKQIERKTNLKMAIEPNRNYGIKGFKFRTIPAYNSHPDKLNFHPKANNWVGYIFELNGKRIYHAGDTDFIPEMETLKDLKLDVAILPIGGKFTMEVEEAAKAANIIAAKVTVPMHYKMLNPDNYAELEEKFKQLVTASEVIVLDELR